MLILYHKHPTSARTRFLRLAHGGVCDSGLVPRDAELAPPPRVATHPAMLLRAAADRLGLCPDVLEADLGYRFGLRLAGEVEQVHLARFIAIDPPFDAAEAIGAAFIDLVEARGLPPIERSLLRLAYEHVLG
jgi:hypothetical protein